MSHEGRVPVSVDNEASRKLIKNIHMAKLVFAGTDWVSKCLQAHQLIISHKLGSGSVSYLKKEEPKNLGIQTFLAKLEDFAKAYAAEAEAE